MFRYNIIRQETSKDTILLDFCWLSTATLGAYTNSGFYTQ